MKQNLKLHREILIDEPARQDEFHGRGHERTATALVNDIVSFSDQDRAIGLDGPWGSGKSTVVEIARQKLLQAVSKRSKAYHFFTFDIWQSQGASFRRSFLEHLLQWSMSSFPKKKLHIQEIERNLKGKIREVESSNQSILDWWGITIIALIPFLPIYYFWAKVVFDDQKRQVSYFCSGPMLVLYGFLFLTIISAFLKIKPRPLRGIWGQFKIALSQTLLISSKQFENQKVTQFIRETDPNDFEFQITLRTILSVIQDAQNQVVIVLDNIDRLPPKEINEYWAQVRSVFSATPHDKNHRKDDAVIAIVPYDRHLIEAYSQANNGSDYRTADGVSSLGSKEIFSKTFDEVLQVSPPIMSNSKEFFIRKMAQALPDLEDTDAVFRTFLIFDHILRREQRNATPRQIISFINELTGVYVLHQGAFKLPTVAVYIANSDRLSRTPSLLTEEGWVDTRYRSLASDQDLEKNVAAMVFNVDPELAYQLLLDKPIAAAATEGANQLIAISKSAGFDLRIGSVVNDIISDWERSGSYAAVIRNFAELKSVYTNHSMTPVMQAIVRAIQSIDILPIDQLTYPMVFRAFEFCDQEYKSQLAVSLLKAGYNSLGDKSRLEQGQAWASFLTALVASLDDDTIRSVSKVINNVAAFPSDANFTFGFSSKIPDAVVDVFKLEIPSIQASSDLVTHAGLAVDDPHAARFAYRSLVRKTEFSFEFISAISSELIKSILANDEDNSAVISDYIELIAEFYSYCDSARRGDLNISSLYGASNFYSVILDEDDVLSNSGIGAALFLAIMEYEGQLPGVPTKTDALGRAVADNSDSYVSFTELFLNPTLEAETIRRISDLTKMCPAMGMVVGYGAKNPENTMLASVVKDSFLSGTRPTIVFSVLAQHYQYVRECLDGDITRALELYSGSVTENEFSKFSIDQVPTSLIRDAIVINQPQWKSFIARVGELLQGVPVEEWPVHLEESDDVYKLLVELIQHAGFEFSSSNFRDVYIDFIVGVMSGHYGLVQKPKVDELLKAISPSFHSDVLRSIREKLTDVKVSGLLLAAEALPETLSMLITAASSLSKKEKENMVRFLLCPALEGLNVGVVNDFINLGAARIKDLVRSSDEATQLKLDGALAAFINQHDDKNFSTKVSDLVKGKRKSQAFLGKIFNK